MAAKGAAPRKAAKKSPAPLLAFEPADEPLDLPADETAQQDAKDESEPPATGFVWTPKSGGKPIVLPTEFPSPDKLWLWERYNENFTTQSFAWLEWAKVPKAVQRRCVSLPDDEYFEMLTAWFKHMGGATPGE